MGTRAELDSLNYNLAIEKGAKQRLEDKYAELQSISSKILEFGNNISNIINDIGSHKESYKDGEYIWEGEYYSRIDGVVNCTQTYCDIINNLKNKVDAKIEETGDAIETKQDRIWELEGAIARFVLDEEDGK